MKKALFALLALCLGAMGLYAAGQLDSGRETGLDTIEAGQFIDPAKIDAYAYINDYPFPFEPDPARDLTVVAKLEKERVLTIGDRFNLFIGLHVNNQDFFGRSEGNYIVFIHNPEMLLRNEWRRGVVSSLTKILTARKSDAVVGLFDPVKNEIIKLTTPDSINRALDGLARERKVFAVDGILHNSFGCMEALDNNYSTRFLWVTDSDLLKNDAAGRAAYFDFLIKLQSQNNISFSYLGYGEVPNWAVMNQSLKNAGGNSYYVDSPAAIEEKIRDDYDRFVYPAVRDVKVSVSLMPWITESRHDYRSAWYPVTWAPTSTYYTHTRKNELPSMEPGEHKIYLYYLNIAADISVARDQYFREIFNGGAVPVGFCSVEYYSHAEDRTIYNVYPLEISYTEDYAEYAGTLDPMVRKYTILQNTGFILKELSQLVNKREYYTAILLVDSQIKLLEDFADEDAGVSADGSGGQEIKTDIETLSKYRALLMEQARSLNYIQ